MSTSESVTNFEAGETAAASAPSDRILSAAADLIEGLRQSWLWTTLAHQDLKLRYRGSILGPFWQTITTAGMITEGCSTFYSVQRIIQQVRLSFSLHAYRLVYRNLLILLHNFVIIPIVFAIFPKPVVWLRVFELGPGLVLILLNGVWVSILFGMISARFRDVPPIVASIVQVVFFITPIFWPAAALGEHRWLAEFNPIYAAIDVMRAPLLGEPTEPHSWLILAIVTVLGCIGTFAFFARFRTRIAYWA